MTSHKYENGSICILIYRGLDGRKFFNQRVKITGKQYTEEA
jgi:hypothetical protein